MDQSFEDSSKFAPEKGGFELAYTTAKGEQVFALPQDHPTNRAHWICCVPSRFKLPPKNPSKFHKLFFGGILRKPLVLLCYYCIQFGYFFLNFEVSLEESLALYAKNRGDGKGSE